MLSEYFTAGCGFYHRPGSSDLAAIKDVFEPKSDGYFKGFRDTDYFFTALPGEKWLDLGANIGAFSVRCARAGATLAAFEPEPENFSLLKKNIALNGVRVDPVNAAVIGGHEKKMMLSLGKPGQNWRSSLMKKKSDVSVEVDCVNINELITREIDGIKLDVEGAEQTILPAVRSWHRVKKFVMEYHFDVEPRMKIFYEHTARLRKGFKVVRHRRLLPGELHHYFPAAVNVYCWNP